MENSGKSCCLFFILLIAVFCFANASSLEEAKAIQYMENKVICEENLKTMTKNGPQAETVAKYGYYYKGRFVSLNAGGHLFAVKKQEVSFKDCVGYEASTMTKSPGDREPLRKWNLDIYRLTDPKGKKVDQIDLDTQLESLAVTADAVIQPVFEQGPALLIPSDEVIAGFGEATSLARAQEYFAPYLRMQGIDEVREHRKDTYILKINDPSNGRVYQVCQFLSTLDKVDFAEPNHIVVRPPDADIVVKAANSPHTRDLDREEYPFAGGDEELSRVNPYADTPVDWTILVHEDFEDSSLPAGWSTGRWAREHAEAYWSVTSDQAHSGGGSCYATGGGSQGVPSPGPYPNNSFSWLDTPALDLASYEEVYIEVWFYAKYQNPVTTGTLLDYGLVGIYNPLTGSTTNLQHLTVPETGDLTADPTTDNGWRRALFRVPPALRMDRVMVEFSFQSDSSIAEEGLYIDEVRVLGTTEVDTEPLGDDTYGARLYHLENAGQIAGLGDDGNDMQVREAWDLVSVSDDVVVAVIDDGIDLTHPDLNVVTGYDYDGSDGGGARGSQGTACAGIIGAIRNNSMGVIGVAPNVKIMPIYKGTTQADFSGAIDVALVNGAHILSNSWGWVGAPSQDIENAINAALAQGRIVIFAAGNGPDQSPWTYDVAFPANLTDSTDLICVGASSLTDEHKGAASSDGLITWGSSYLGSGPDICAPGSWTYTTDRQGSEGYNDGSSGIAPDYCHDFGGTSSSAPMVAGVAALILSVNPTLTPADVKRILRSTADDIEDPGIDDKTGAGRVNAVNAVAQSRPATLQFSTPAYSVDENGGTVTITVTRTDGSEGAVSVDYATSDGTAEEGNDYDLSSGTLNWAAQDTLNKIFSVTIIDDTENEADKTVNMALSNPVGALLGAVNTAVLAIIDDDEQMLQFSKPDYSVDENRGTATITVTRSNGSEGAVSVDYATSPDTAEKESDYTSANGTLNWAAQDTSNQSFTVTIINDTIDEPDETLTLTLINPVGAVLGTQKTAVLTIKDNDEGGGSGSGCFISTAAFGF